MKQNQCSKHRMDFWMLQGIRMLAHLETRFLSFTIRTLCIPKNSERNVPIFSPGEKKSINPRTQWWIPDFTVLCVCQTSIQRKFNLLSEKSTVHRQAGHRLHTYLHLQDPGKKYTLYRGNLCLTGSLSARVRIPAVLHMTPTQRTNWRSSHRNTFHRQCQS